MNAIKFSHDYPKLHGQTSATLLAVVPIRIDRNTPKELIEYDTHSWHGIDGEHCRASCPLYHGDKAPCDELEWAQMPYESEDGEPVKIREGGAE